MQLQSASEDDGEVTDPVASDLKPQEKALLNAISGPESSGKYNVRYTPSGGTTFDETGEHPAIPEPTSSGEKSTAAGRYQFVKSTWDRVAGDLPFTRENQDRMALKLARQDYNARTGRNLDTDLSAGGLTSGIMKVLAPTWEGFKSGEGQSKASRLYSSSLSRYAAPPVAGEDPSAAMAVAPATAPARSAVPIVPAGAVPLPPRRPDGMTTSAIDLPQDDEYMRPTVYGARGGLVPTPHYAEGGAVDLEDDPNDETQPSRAPAPTSQRSKRWATTRWPTSSTPPARGSTRSRTASA